VLEPKVQVRVKSDWHKELVAMDNWQVGSLLLSLFCRRYSRGGWGPDPSAVTSRSAGHRIPGAPRCDRTSIREGGCYIRGESVSRSKLRCCVTAWQTTATTKASCAPTVRTRATGSPRPHSVRSLPAQRQHKSLSLMKAKDKPAAARLSLSQPMEARPGGSRFPAVPAGST